MAERLLYAERLPQSDPRLGRHIFHDSESRRFAFRAPHRALTAVRHQRHVPVFDQGNLGSCTGNAAIGCLATGLFRATVTTADADWIEPLDQAAAVECYSRATRIDPWPGGWNYPPPPGSGEDTGSDGLSVAKVLTAAGAISGYQHAFTLADALAALMDRPLITGTYWLSDMFSPAASGLVTPTGSVAGGHEYILDEYDPTRGWVGFTNSWGGGWGRLGRFYMEAEKYGALLARDGDVTVFTPTTEPAPVPDPADPEIASAADRVMWPIVKPFATGWGLFTGASRRALRDWHAAKRW